MFYFNVDLPGGKMETKKTVLLIDDEVDFTEMTRFILENANFSAVIANTPADGLEKAKNKPDIILLDVNMPDMDGYEVCRRLKEDEVTMAVPIIMLTSQNKTLDKIEAFNLGVIDFITKDTAYEEILVRIKAVLKRTSPNITFQSLKERDDRIIELRKIIDQKSIRTLYQPIVVMANRQPFGYEALARGPKGTFFENPINLFNVASDSHMSFELDTICMNLAVKRAEPFLKEALLFLNADPSLILSDYLRGLKFLEGVQISPSQICIEISERTFVTNFKELASNLRLLKPMGVMIVIDDLGEGYSSLKAIAELNPEFIKIDISLIRGVNVDPTKQNLVKMIYDLSKKIKSCAIAEGIETEEENQTLMSLGIEYGQGYLFARPAEFAVT